MRFNMKKQVAIIGTAFRFPSTDSSRYWDDLLQGSDLVTTVEDGRWAKDTFLHPHKSNPGTSYTFAAGSIGDIAGFDAGFFGISPREAAQIDPQQRLLLEMSWEAFENAGVKPSSLRGSSCGVFVGISSADYAYRMADDMAAIESSTATGNTQSIAANRLSYFFDLHGPSMAIDTACSSSLVAFHQACRAILSGECSHALVGGVSLHSHPYGFISFSKSSMLSKRGRCSVFDAAGDGYVRSEGGGIFLLKEYDAAVAGGDRIIAVVANSALNTDGHKPGLTVPSAAAQAALLEMAYAQAGIDPSEIDYIEAHGTGTAVGDPIETRALGEALGKKRPRKAPLPIGSVKGNLGHLEAASGLAGLVKALFSIKHRIVPATIGLKTPNPYISFTDLNIEVVTENRPLKPSGRLIVGVNSFGFGGANAHVILASHDTPPANESEMVIPAGSLPIILSAASDDGLKATAKNFAEYLRKPSVPALYDIAYHAAFRKDWLGCRAIVHGSTHEEIAQALTEFAGGKTGISPVESGKALERPAGPAFIYSGNGSQWAGMGKELFKEPCYRKAIEEVDAIFRGYAGFSLMDKLAGISDENYEFTEIAQPALFAVQVGITELLRARGIRPLAVAGHSVGEIAAAWAAGALTLEAAVKVIYHRSRLQGTTKGNGNMTAVAMAASSVLCLLETCGLDRDICLAGINSPRGVTLAGDPGALSCFEKSLQESGVIYKRLDLDYAFHSPAMDCTETGIREALAGIRPVSSAVPFYSAVTGGLLAGPELLPDYWWRNIRNPVLFEEAIESIHKTGINVFIEVGPHPVLRGYIIECLKSSEIGCRTIPTMSRDVDPLAAVCASAGQAIIAGARIHWDETFPVQGRFVELPPYFWQKEPYWHGVTSESQGILYRKMEHPLLGYRLTQQELCWENQLDAAKNNILADHVVGEAMVFPGTGYVELGLAAAKSISKKEYVELEELDILSPLILSSDHAKVLRLAVQPSDGSFTIKAREYAGSDAWTLHAVGRILEESGNALLKKSLPDLPARPPDFNHNIHQTMTEAVGLEYGAAFRAIEYGWVENNTALALLQIPEAIEDGLEHYHLHPSLLDCTFQLIIQLLRDEIPTSQGIVYVPTKVGRISLRTGMTPPRYAQATLLRRSPHSLLAEFMIFDEAGEPIACIKDARFRSIRLQKRNREQVRHIGYHCVPKPLSAPSDVSVVFPFDPVLHTMKNVVRDCGREEEPRRYMEELDPLLDKLCGSFTLEALAILTRGNWDLLNHRILDIHSSNPQLGLFLNHLLQWANADGRIQFSQGAWFPSPAASDPAATARDIWNSLVSDYPDNFQIIHAVGRMGLHLPALLEGRAEFAKIRPAEASMPMLMRQVFGFREKHQIGRALGDAVVSALHALPTGRRLSILEVCEGPPTFAENLCSALDFDRGDFCFTSPSSESLESARYLQERYPAMQILQLSTDPADPAAQFDEQRGVDFAVVALDFLQIGENIKALKYAKKRLNRNGLLLVLGQHPARWIDFVFGSYPSWWSEAPDGFPVSQQQPLSFWQQQMEQLGFAGTEALQVRPDTGSYILIAQNLSAVDFRKIEKRVPRHWLIFAEDESDASVLAFALCRKLHELGDGAITVPPGDRVRDELILRKMQAGGKPIDGIVYLAGMRKAQDPSSSILDQQIQQCMNLGGILKACETAQSRAVCWLVTGNAMTGMLPDSSGFNRIHASSEAMADAALWGFGRVLINETMNNAVRLIDLEARVSDDVAAQAIIAELESQDGEDEVVLLAGGERFVTRMSRIQERILPAENLSQDEPPLYRLGFDMPGMLSHLRWEKLPYTPPADDELEVQVHATGLNFRDIMYALGLLSDEAIENGYAGATLGLEFSGTVIKAGAKTGGFKPGDRVVGFGSGGFSNRIMAKPDAVAHIPQGISFEAAATIPSAFFTAYYSLCHLGRLGEGEKVLIHGAAGGVGIAAIQIARWCGAEIFASAGTDEKRDFLRMLGVDHILNSRSLSYEGEIMELTEGRGIDMVLNSLAGEAINRNFRVLKPFGRFLELGKRDFYENTKIGLRPFRNNITYFGIDADQLMRERPELTRRLFAEVMALFRDGVLHPLPCRAFEAKNIVESFRYMQQSRQIGKIVVTYRNGIAVASERHKRRTQPLALTDNASYLVTGGLSGFGLKTAQWLAAKGARYLVLINRSGLQKDEAGSAVAELERSGVRILAKPCDVADKKQLAEILQEASRQFPPLKGIVHAAAVIEDGLIRNLNTAQMRRVFEPKILGAQNLHDLTLDKDLDFFVLFSSATTLFGNPGQGNYVAANSWLEAFARYRRGLGLPATSVLWGAIGDAGFLARNEKTLEALQKRIGGMALHSSTALDELEHMLIGNDTGEGVLDFDWKALARFLPGANAPKYSEFTRQTGAAGDDENQDMDVQNLLATLPDDELADALAEILKQELGKILRISPDKIDPSKSVYDMGLDSLMGVELVIALEARFGFRLPVMTLSESPTIAKLSSRVVAQLRGNEKDGASPSSYPGK
jgi:phthiocerol/phenolphthiocerol synthesis type-I polyketide synthase C